MKRLRHPVRAVREPFGTAGLIVACIAIVLALGGAAFAAAKLNSTQKKEVEKIAKKFAGKRGATGPAGSAGSQGPAGANGSNGAKGATGAAGQKGSEGATGATGPQGEPWTAGGTLPSEATETGMWSIGALPAGTFSFEQIPVPASFNIPLSAPLDATHVHFIKPNEAPPAGCLGGTVEEPTAEPGNFCVYAQELFFVNFFAIHRTSEEKVGADVTGALISFKGEEEGGAHGTWAVTAP